MKTYLNHARDPISSLTHLIGLIAMAFGLVFLLGRGYRVGSSGVQLVTASVFAISAMLLYFASSYYHYYTGSASHIKVA